MGMTSITAARHLKEQLTGVSQLTMETFPHIALSQVQKYYRRRSLLRHLFSPPPNNKLYQG